MKPGRKLGIAEARYVGVKGLATVIDSFLRELLVSFIWVKECRLVLTASIVFSRD